MVKKGGNLLEKAVLGMTPGIVRNVINADKREPPEVTEMLRKYGDKPLMYIKVNRQPVQSVVKGLLNFFSKDRNNFEKELKKTPYEDIFHLQLIFKVQGSTRILLEKNARISTSLKPHEVDTRDVAFPAGMTIRQIYENGKKKMGANFFPYKSRTNNCQNFVLGLLEGSGLSTPELKSFVLQDVDNIFKTDPKLQKIANTFTDIGAKFDAVVQGGELPKKRGRPSSKYSVRPMYPPTTAMPVNIPLNGGSLAKSITIPQIKKMSPQERQMVANTIAAEHGLSIVPIQGGSGIEAQYLGQISEQAYKKKGQMKDVGNYVLDKSLSGERAQVYHNPKTNEVVVNHRGTKGLKDVYTDALMATGGIMYYPKTKRFDHGKKIQDQAAAKYQGSKMISTGHSLGSQLSKHASKGTNAEVIGFNGAYLPYNLVNDKKNHKKLTNVKNQDDIVNAVHYLNPASKMHKNVVMKNTDKMGILESHSSTNLRKMKKDKYIGFK